MATFRIEKNRNYSVISNEHFRQKDLSLKAKGLLSMMLSLPDSWKFSIEGITALSKDGIDSVKSGLNELKKAGYLEIIKLNPDQTKTGRIEYQYVIYETLALNPRIDSRKQEVDFQGVVFQGVENQSLLNTNILSNKDKSILLDKSNNSGASPTPLTNPSISSESKKKEEAKKDNQKELNVLAKKETSRQKKVKEIVEMRNMMIAFSQNPAIRRELEEYFNFRLSKGLSSKQWKIILDDLYVYTRGDVELVVEKIRNAHAGGFMQIIAPWEKSKASQRQLKANSFDNTLHTSGLTQRTERGVEEYSY